jgi:FtsH-binding integral membrane protein
MTDTVYGTSAPSAVIELDSTRRAQFITRTYQHLLGAILAFTGIEIFLFQSGIAYPIAQAMLSVSWLLVLGGFMVAGWLFSGMAQKATSPAGQYVALGGYVLAQAIIFVPLLVIAEVNAPGAIQSAALATLLGFSGLTAVAMFSGKDFSFMGSMLRWGGVAALVLIVCGVVFGFHLGVFFSVAMVALAGAAILYETSKILYSYPEDMHVAASLSLFASVALMFWYLLSIFSRR